MDLEMEYGRNLTALKRCKKVYNIVGLFFLVAFGFALFCSAYFMILSLFDMIYLRLMLFDAGVLITGFMSTYKKNNILAAASVVLVLIESAFSRFALVLAPFVIAAAVITIIANKKYKWLEQQDGFPYFNSRVRFHEMDRAQWDIKDPYTQQFEELKKRNSNSGHMDEL